MPENYHGNQLKSYGGYLKYTVRHEGQGNPISAPDVILSVSSLRANCVFPHRILMSPREKGYVVAQSVEALRYKPEGCGFDSRWGHWNFSVTYPFGRTMGRGGGGSSRGVGLTNLPLSSANCLEILRAPTSWSS
jgi:hypothetical protein